MPLRFITARIDGLLAWARQRSLWGLPFANACCAAQFACTDLDALGPDAGSCSVAPEGADLLIVMGTVTRRQAGELRAVYERMADPKWVIAMGACAVSGGCYDNYSTVKGIAEIVPVDAYVPGCPPRPEQLAHAIQKVREKISLRKDD